MFIFLLFNTVLHLLFFGPALHRLEDTSRTLLFNGLEVKTTYKVDPKFIGKYSGAKSGYLILKENGSGSYRHDYYVQSGNPCAAGTVEMEWGFLVDEDGDIVRFERPYGFSYPLIYMSTGDISFQACTKKSMIDYLLVYKDGTITVSSSDDWVKGP